MCPKLKESIALLQIVVPVRERLNGVVRDGPGFGYKVLEQTLQHVFKIGRDYDESLDALVELFEGSAHNLQQNIVPGDLLDQHHR